MRLRWTGQALADLDRLYAFLAPVAPDAAANVVQSLSRAPERLLEQPGIGVRLDGYGPREVRRVLIDNYEMRYEIVEDAIYILRLWHCREDR